MAGEDDAVGEDRRRLFDFALPEQLSTWRSVDDVVLGGTSQSVLEAGPKGIGVFRGEVMGVGNTGFASVRTEWRGFSLKGYDGLEALVRGDGRRYAINLKGPNREGDGFVSYRSFFVSTPGSWEMVTLPFGGFQAFQRGKPMAEAPALDLEGVCAIGLLISDLQQGLFRLELRSIEAYREELKVES